MTKITTFLLSILIATSLFAQEKKHFKNRSGWKEELNKTNSIYSAKKAFDSYWTTTNKSNKKQTTRSSGYKPFMRWFDNMAPKTYPSGEMKNFGAMNYEEYKKRGSIKAAGGTEAWDRIGPYQNETPPTPYEVT